MKITVLGASGLIGSKLVRALGQRGHEVVAASLDSGVNTLTGEGLERSLEGARVVVDVTNSPSLEGDAALKFFETSASNIVAAEKKTRVAHHVALSVVGTERLQESGYFRAKLAQEKLIRSAPIPYSIVHSTQFFEFLPGIIRASTVDQTIRLPATLVRPIASGDVAALLADVAEGAPLNRTVEIAGPTEFRLVDLVELFLARRGESQKAVADPETGYFGAAVKERTLVPGPEPRLGSTSFEAWFPTFKPRT